jgi:hypothetical protein|nr:MAG TPA_asm: hypothetical protein [Caudoviricetes sp.]
MRDYLISRKAVIDELTFRLGLSNKALHEAMSLVPDYVKAGRYGDVAEVCTEVIGFAYTRGAYKLMLRMVKSMPVKGECGRGDSNAQH